MAGRFYPIWCDECGVEITWTPVVIGGRPYCCHDCAVGLECNCASLDTEWEDESNPFELGGAEGNLESSFYGLDYGFD